MTYGCLGIHQSLTVQRYRIYRLTEYIRYMFTTESLKGNLLIQMRLTFTYKTHKFFHAYVLNNSLPHSCGGLLGFKGVNMKWRVVTLLKSCDYVEGLWTLWKVVSFLKSYDRLKGCAFSKVLWPFWKVIFFSNDCDLYSLLAINREAFSHFCASNSSLLFTYISYKTKSIDRVCVLIRCCLFEFVEIIEVWGTATSLTG